MGKPLFMMSVKKRNEIKMEEERREREEMKVRKELFTPKRGLEVGSVSKFPTYTHRSSGVEINRPETVGGSTAKIESPIYTGDKMIGVAVMHKSCLQPIFSQEEAVESATMRRG